MRQLALGVVVVLAACQSVRSETAPLFPQHPAAVTASPHPVVSLGAATSSALTTVHVGRTLVGYIADEDDQALRVIDVDEGQELSVLPLEGRPTQVVALPRARLAVTLRDASKVAILEGAGTRAWPLRTVAYLDVPPEPIALARTPDNASLVVTSAWGHALTVFSVDGFERRAVVDLGREPRGVVVSGKRAFVSHAAGNALSIVDLEHPDQKAKVWYLDAESWTLGWRAMMQGPFARKSNNANAIALSDEPAGRVFVPHGLSHTTHDGENGDGASAGYGGGGVGANDVFDVAVIDAAKATPIDFEPRPGGDEQIVRLAGDGTQCLVPRAAVTFGAKLLVACADTNKVLELDAGWFHPQDLATRTFAVPSGPTGISVDADGARVVVWSQFARKVTLLPLASGATFTLATIDVAATHPLDQVIAHGRELFFHRDARLSSDGRVCASCHPDGRDDGLVWMTPEGPRQTPMLAGRLDGTAPYGWRGASPDVETHLKTTVARLNGKGLEGADKAALIAFVRSLPMPKAPKVDAALAKRGEAIFDSERAGCASCHGVGGDLPDGERHNVRSWSPGDVIGVFDTPSLRGAAGTAPYFHDGRYKDLHTLLVSTSEAMGHTKDLSPADMTALETYVRSL